MQFMNMVYKEDAISNFIKNTYSLNIKLCFEISNKRRSFINMLILDYGKKKRKSIVGEVRLFIGIWIKSDFYI